MNKKWLQDNWFKGGIILIGLIIATSIGYYYLGFLPEKENARVEREEKLDQQKYEETRRAECLNIFKAQDEKWNNVQEHEYVPEDDICYISFDANSGEWDGIVCEEILKDWNYELFPLDGAFSRSQWRRARNCENNEFEKEF